MRLLVYFDAKSFITVAAKDHLSCGVGIYLQNSSMRVGTVWVEQRSGSVALGITGFGLCCK